MTALPVRSAPSFTRPTAMRASCLQVDAGGRGRGARATIWSTSQQCSFASALRSSSRAATSNASRSRSLCFDCSLSRSSRCLAPPIAPRVQNVDITGDSGSFEWVFRVALPGMLSRDFENAAAAAGPCALSPRASPLPQVLRLAAAQPLALLLTRPPAVLLLTSLRAAVACKLVAGCALR